ncbi:MAG: stage II sporulation protein R [Clostridia bacterium]|nr:stage II sporulation protein R [Clostridia bacterium]
MSRWLKAITGGLLLTLLFQFCGFAGNCDAIRTGVVRVHILAHSDSAEDQALKLKVRDAVTAAGADVLDGTEDVTAARQKLGAALPALCAAAQQCVYENGYPYEVRGELTNMYFTTRTYDSGTFPAGYYDAVRFTIGAGEGRNWWCVMYPPLCVSAAADPDTLSDTFTDAQTDMIENSGRYEVRFKLVEWWERLLSYFR